jgi:hypothetical protein
MANYYTYGMVPDVDETVYGTSVSYGGLGNPEYVEPSSSEEPVAVNRGLPEEEPVGPSPLGEYNAPQPMPTRREDVEPISNLFVEGADAPASTGIDYDAMARAFGMLGASGSNLEPIAYGRGFSLGNLEGGLPITENRNVRATPAAQLSLEQLGLTREEADKIAAQYDANKAAVSPLAQLSTADVAAQAGVSEADLAASQEQIGGVYGARRNTLQEISDRLQKNDFKGAFNVAVSAEDAGEGQFFENVVNPELMRYLRGPMTKDEIKQFYEAIPQDEYIKRYGEGNMFILQKGIDESLAALGDDEVGYADPRAALIARPDPTVGIIGDLAAAALAATGIGIPAAMAISGAQKYITSGGNLKAALTSAALTGVGMKVGEAVKAGLTPGLQDLTGVTTTASKAATAAADAAAKAVSSGVAPGALQEIIVTAARQAAPNLAQGVIGSVTGSVLNQLAAQGVDIPEQQLQQAQQATQRSPIEQAQATANVNPGLEEIVVQSLRKGAPVDINTLLASTGVQGAQDILSERQIQEQQELEQREAQEQAKEKEPSDFAGTFEITADRLPQLDITKAIPNLGSQLYDAGYRPPGFEGMPADDLAEVVVRGSKPLDLDLTVPIPDLSNQFSRPPYDKPAFADTPLEEVVVETSRPTELDLVAPPFDIPKTTKPSIETPEGALEEIVVEGKRPDDLDLIAPPFTIPGKTPVEGVTEPKINEPNPLKGLLDKYGSVENFLKLIGALGSAFSKSPTVPAGGAGIGAGGMGGALPKYTYTRQQLSPDIDYYTYGTRPEAKFFEDKLQLEKPVQPELPPANPPEPDMVMAEGGLTGYAKGGSKSSRYVDGPGSGREDKIPALLSDGEYVIDAETLALLGDGSTKEGARRMDDFRANIRKHKGRALSRGRISPNAKSPSKYMGGGLT